MSDDLTTPPTGDAPEEQAQTAPPPPEETPTKPTAPPIMPGKRRNYPGDGWIWVLLTLLIIIAVALGWFFTHQEAQRTAVTPPPYAPCMSVADLEQVTARDNAQIAAWQLSPNNEASVRVARRMSNDALAGYKRLEYFNEEYNYRAFLLDMSLSQENCNANEMNVILGLQDLSEIHTRRLVILQNVVNADGNRSTYPREQMVQ